MQRGTLQLQVFQQLQGNLQSRRLKRLEHQAGDQRIERVAAQRLAGGSAVVHRQSRAGIAQKASAIGILRHLVAWIRQESNKIRHLWRLTDSEVSSLLSELAYPRNKVAPALTRVTMA